MAPFGGMKVWFLRRFQFDQGGAQRRSFSQNDGAFNEVLEFPSIARPLPAAENGHRVSRYGIYPFIHLLGVHLEKMIGQQRDILGPGA